MDFLEKFKKEESLQDYSGEDRVIHIEEYRKEVAERAIPAVKLMSHMEILDKTIEGFEGGELIVISGPTKHGKTTFAQSLTKNFEEQMIHCLWFSFEVTLKQLMEKYVHGYYVPRRLKDKNMDWIKDKIVESQNKFGTQAVFIDHLHYLVDLERSHSPSIEIGVVIRKLKTIAVELNIVIFLMAHTTKTRTDEVPTEMDVRDSSLVAQEADSTMMVWREKVKDKRTKQYMYTSKTLLIISNHRRVGVMDARIGLEFKNGYLVEIKDSYNAMLEQELNREQEI